MAPNYKWMGSQWGSMAPQGHDDKGRLSLKISGRARQRWEHYANYDDRHNETMNRLMDDAGVPESLYCERCGTDALTAHAKLADGPILCLDCADVDRELLG